jgi:hypothetical protein
MRRTIETDRGERYVIFTPEHTGCPEAHGGPWHFEPEEYEGDVFSPGYPTAETAEEAAIAYDAQEAIQEAEAARLAALVKASGIVDGTGTLHTVCEQAIRDGEGTPERVREIWATATEEWSEEAARLDAED